MGARASLGASADAVGAAYHAGISRHRQLPSLLGRAYAPLIVARDPYLPPEVPVERRLLEMVTHAAAQAIEPLTVMASQPPLDVLVALPDPGAGVGPRVPERVLGALQGHLAERVRLGDLQAVHGGRSAGLLALEIAVERLVSGRSAACLWCGVDSYLAPATLDMLDGAGVLHAGGARWGFVPGEAAAACLLVTGDRVEPAGPPPLAVVRAAASAAERSLHERGEVSLGEALTNATRAILGALPEAERVHRIYADLNGARERVDDVGFTLARIADRVASLPCLATPADRLGEVGAASAPLFAVLAVADAQRGHAPGPNVLLWTTGPGALSAAALLTVPVRARDR
jgi:3-oxoacyl-[acyl-carrier-protein] synthase-1